MRYRVWLGILALGSMSLVASAQRGHSITGGAPLGASGAAPLGSTGSLIRAGSGGYRSGGYGSGTIRNGSARGGFQTNQFRGSSERGYRRGYYGSVSPFFYGLGYLPYGMLDYGDDSGPSPYAAAPVDTPEDPLTQHYEVQENILGSEIEHLNSELEEMRQEQSVRPPYRPNVEPAETTPPSPPVTVVLQDGHRFDSSNYAVMDGTFWDFSRSPSRRVPMSQVNVPASVEASAAHGAEFPE